MSKVREMVTSSELRHVPVGPLALLTQRLGAVFLSASTWHRLVRERSWRRPRLLLHPKQPVEGVRASRPNELWHIDVTVLRLLDGTRIYLHAVIDNFSRRTLAWRLSERLCGGGSVSVLLAAARWLPGDPAPTVFVDDGVENMNREVDRLVDSGVLKRVLAMVEVRHSNSMIEAWWRSLKHNGLFLHRLESVAAARLSAWGEPRSAPGVVRPSTGAAAWGSTNDAEDPARCSRAARARPRQGYCAGSTCCRLSRVRWALVEPVSGWRSLP